MSQNSNGNQNAIINLNDNGNQVSNASMTSPPSYSECFDNNNGKGKQLKVHFNSS